MNVLVIGGISYNSMVYLDELPQPMPQTIFANHFHETIGSTGAGKALNLKKLGFDITLQGLVGDDLYGNRIREILAQNEIPVFLERDPAGTKRHLNLMAADGSRISIFLEKGSPELDIDIGSFRDLIEASDLIVLNILNFARALIPWITESGKPIWCDIHDYNGRDNYHRDFIKAADVIQVSSDGLTDWRSFMAELVSAGKSWVICTHGRRGATGLSAPDQWIEMPAILDYQRVDTNGAGDAFFAGVLLGKSRGLDLERSLRLGAVVSGLCITSSELAHPDLSLGWVEREYFRHFDEPLPSTPVSRS